MANATFVAGGEVRKEIEGGDQAEFAEVFGAGGADAFERFERGGGMGMSGSIFQSEYSVWLTGLFCGEDVFTLAV